MEANDFNKAMAELDGLEHYIGNTCVMAVQEDETQHTKYDPYFDLNQLMPLAWKYGVSLLQAVSGNYSAFNDIEYEIKSQADPIEAVRQCLIAIHKGNDDGNK